MNYFLEYLSKLAVYLITFLLPLFFLPFTSSVLDLNKQFLLLVLGVVGVLAWLLKAILEGKLTFPFNWLYLPVGVFFLVVLASAIFSFYPYSSFWGHPLKTSQAFFTFLGFGFYFLLVNLVLSSDPLKKALEAKKLIGWLLVSATLACVLGIAQVYQKFFLPWDFTKSASFNTIGSINSWAVFLGALIPLVSLMVLFLKGLARWLSLGALILFLFGLLAVNFWVAWMVSLAGLIVIISFGLFYFSQKERSKILLPLILFAIAVFFGIFRIGLVIVPSQILEVAPTYNHTLDIAFQTLKERPVFGSGPGTFSFDYAKYRSEAINQTIFWNTRFVNGASELFEWLATMGLLGVLAFLVLVACFIYVEVKEILKNFSDNQVLILSSLSLFLGVFLGFLLYPVSLPFQMLFWLAGAFILSFASREVKWDFYLNKLGGVLVSLVFIIFFIGSLGLIFENTKRYIAELNYILGLQAFSANNLEGAIDKISLATQINPKVDVYWRDLSKLALEQLNLAVRESAQKEDQEKLQELQTRIQNLSILAVNSANQAVELNGQNVLNWLNRGEIYRNLIGLAQGAFEHSISSYQKARELEPKNPEVNLEIARTNLTQAQLHLQLREQDKAKELLTKAMEELNKAIELKNNFWPAYFQQALVLDTQGDLDKAIAKLEEIKPFNQQDPGLAFQLGSYYFKKEDLERAKREFERALRISPNFANAYYFLGLIYDKQGDKTKAIEQFEKIASMSEENAKKVSQILDNLRKGLPALGQEQKVQQVPQLEEEQK